MRGKVLGYAAALIAMTAQPAAAMAQDFCITRDEMRKGLSYFAPMLIDGLVQSCAPYMAADAPLLKIGPSMAESYRAVAAATDEDMMALFAKIGGVTGDPPPADLAISTIKNELFSEMAEDIKSEDCVIIDKFASDLSALPAANVIGLMETGIIMAELKDRQKKAKRTRKPIAPSIICGA